MLRTNSWVSDLLYRRNLVHSSRATGESRKEDRPGFFQLRLLCRSASRFASRASCRVLNSWTNASENLPSLTVRLQRIQVGRAVVPDCCFLEITKWVVIPLPFRDPRTLRILRLVISQEEIK